MNRSEGDIMRWGVFTELGSVHRTMQAVYETVPAKKRTRISQILVLNKRL